MEFRQLGIKFRRAWGRRCRLTAERDPSPEWKKRLDTSMWKELRICIWKILQVEMIINFQKPLKKKKLHEKICNHILLSSVVNHK